MIFSDLLTIPLKVYKIVALDRDSKKFNMLNKNYDYY